MIECRIELFRSEDGSYGVRLLLPDELAVVDRFAFDDFGEGRPREIIAKLENGSCPNSEVLEIGTYIWNALRPEAVRNALGRITEPYSVGLLVPEAFEINRIPWEAAYDEAAGRYVACDDRRALTRVIPEQRFALSESPAAGPIRMLVVVPEGSGLDIAKELSDLRSTERSFGPKRMEVQELTGAVTTDRLYDALHATPFDILHFIGHSRFNRGAGVEIRINAERKLQADGVQWLTANQFAEILSGSTIRLAVFNSCESAPSASDLLTGLGRQVATVAGVPAVVAMRYRIDDLSSTRFTETFYRHLLGSRFPGRVDKAMQAARHSLYVNARADLIRSFLTPILYLAPGHAQIFDEARISGLAVTQVAPQAPAAAALELPPDLVQRLHAGRCLPIVGPGLFPAATRDAVPNQRPTLSRILNLIADQGQYPDRDELLLLDSVADFVSVIWPRILQHYESCLERPTLIEYLQECCRGKDIPQALRRIASWNLPGIVYTHIDGLMEEAMRVVRPKEPQLVNIPHQKLATSAEGGAPDADLVLLFNLRGTLTDAESLVLTDSDHERLMHDDLPRASPDVVKLFRGAIGRSVLFIGVSPMDPAVRRLARLYLEPGRPRLQGPRYFVVPHVSAGDRAYWETYNVRWIEQDPLLVVESLDAALREA